MKDLISIVTPTWNKKEYLQQMIEAVVKNTQWPYELIIVDNGSNDGTKKYLDNLDLKIKGQIIYNEENLGFAKANNQGVGIAKGNFICFLNNDTIPTKGWLTAMMKVFSEEKACGCVGAKLLHPGKETIQHAGVIEKEDGRPDHIYFGKSANFILANDRRRYFGVTAACMVMPKGLYKSLGGFDEDYWCGWEDMDMMQKLRLNNQRVYYEPKAVVYHYESRTEGRYSQEGNNFNLYVSRWVLRKEGDNNG